MATSYYTGTDGVEYPGEREEVEYIVVDTDIPQIKVHVYPGGSHRLYDTHTNTAGEVVSYAIPCQLPIPEEAYDECFGKDARWVYFSNYWRGTFPVSRVLVLSSYQ